MQSSANSSPTESQSLPALVMLPNSLTPYRIAFHLRLARELTDYRLLSVITHDESNSPWKLQSPAEINAHFFGNGDPSSAAPSSPWREWRRGGRIIDFLRRENVGALVLHGYNDMGRLRVLRWCHAKGIPVFLWADSNARSDHATGNRRRVKKALLAYVLKRCTGVMVCGSLGKEYMLSYGADPARIFYVPYEPDYAQIQELAGSKIEAAAQQFGLEAGRRRILYSGRMVPEKRVDLLIQAFVAIADERPEWDLVVAGGGPLLAELQALVPSGLAARVKWLGFLAGQETVSAVYRNCDVLCLPSDYEPWALVINEAAAADLAIVSSDVVGASAELVRDGVNGKLFRSKDLGDATAALRYVTDATRIDTLRAGSAGVLRDWRREGDPVAGIRKGLELASKSR